MLLVYIFYNIDNLCIFNKYISGKKEFLLGFVWFISQVTTKCTWK